jgi:HAD superfamily hydrolase (TIGR01450 family)
VRPAAWLCDLDGVVWRGSTAIAGSPETVVALRSAGERVVFISNNSSTTVADYLAKLAAVGIPTGTEDLVTSAQAAAELVRSGMRVMVLGGPGITEAVNGRGAEAVDAGVEKPGSVDAVIVGLDRAINYQRLSAAVTAVLGGAVLIGTNEDPTFPTTDGLRPGGGSLLAAVMYATSASPVVAGKPHLPIAALTLDRLGPAGKPTDLAVKQTDAAGVETGGGPSSTPSPAESAAELPARRNLVMIGDQPRTDGLFAKALGAQFALVLTGVTSDASGVVPVPDHIAADLRELVAQFTGLPTRTTD